jgi:hypothetical protein
MAMSICVVSALKLRVSGVAIARNAREGGGEAGTQEAIVGP